ncbi:MAG TPA: toprim domain-containing protein, partial [Burkholderiales bacterium]|nr:toprim domain-containing protein [Burkholderiales bacterium]
LEKLFPDYAKNPFLIDSGLVIKNEANKIYDRFRGRIIFPIRNTKGDVIAFGGRVINNSEPKYLNSPETVLFNKSQELYGLFEGQKSIRSKNQVIIVEGYMDVIALNQFGINNVVATMGTAITDEHIKKLFRLCDNIYYAFDGDNAGRKAAWRALERSIANITDTKASYFLFFPKEHDPDSFIRNKGANEFINQLNNNSVPLSSFLLNQLSSEVNINTEEGKARLISLAKPFLEQTKAIALQVILKKQLAKIVELETNVLESILNNRSRYAFYNNQWKNNSQLPVKENIIKINLVEIIIRHALHNISWVIKYKLPENINFHSQEIQELALIIDFIHNNYNINDNIELIKITEYVNSHTLDLENIYNNNNIINLTEEEFRQTLDNLFGLSARKVVKIPKIPMKEQSNE